LLKNPYSDPKLRGKTGVDPQVQLAVMESKHAKDTFNRINDVINSEYIHRADMVIGLQCTGGTHRSVAMAELVGEWQRAMGREVEIVHKDLGRWFGGKR
jgi:UPF0042 nucleotide-binding protein